MNKLIIQGNELKIIKGQKGAYMIENFDLQEALKKLAVKSGVEIGGITDG